MRLKKIGKRGSAIIALVLVLGALVGALWAMDARKNGPTSANAKRMETAAARIAADGNFIGAGIFLGAYVGEHGTYAGAVLPASFRVQLVRADGTSYCLQTGVETGGVMHVVGPSGGAPASGPC